MNDLKRGFSIGRILYEGTIHMVASFPSVNNMCLHPGISRELHQVSTESHPRLHAAFVVSPSVLVQLIRLPYVGIILLPPV